MRIWFVDAFAQNVFEGNTAAVAPLDAWPPDALMQAIAGENRCAETAFFIPTGLKGNYQLRWFTPTAEAPLCGHATLAAGYVLLTEIAPELDMAVFDTLSGPLVVRKTEHGVTLDLPRTPRSAWDAPAELSAALGGVNFVDAFVAGYANVVLPSEKSLRALAPDFAAIARLVRGPRAGCLTVTAAADEGAPYDFVCRFFGPGLGVPEDSVTGSAFADLAPYWCDRLGKNAVTGFQASPRGGYATALQTLSSVRLLGRVSPYLRGELDSQVLAQTHKFGAAKNQVAPVAPGHANTGAPSTPSATEDELTVHVHELEDGHADRTVKILDWDPGALEAHEISAVRVLEPSAPWPSAWLARPSGAAI